MPEALPDALKLKGYLVDVVVALEDLSKVPLLGSRRMLKYLGSATLNFTILNGTTNTAPFIGRHLLADLVTDSDISTRPASSTSLDGYKSTLQRYEKL